MGAKMTVGERPMRSTGENCQAEDLKDLGVVLGGHSRRLVDAVAALDTPSGIAGGDRRR